MTMVYTFPETTGICARPTYTHEFPVTHCIFKLLLPCICEDVSIETVQFDRFRFANPPFSKLPSGKILSGQILSTFKEILLVVCSKVLTSPCMPCTVVFRLLAVCSTVLTLVPKELTCDAVLEICPLADFISAVLVSTSFSRPVTESVTVVTLVDNKPISPSAAVISACTFS